MDLNKVHIGTDLPENFLVYSFAERFCGHDDHDNNEHCDHDKHDSHDEKS